jgi:outer membrane protein TolC
MLLELKNAMLEEQSILNKNFEQGLIDATLVHSKEADLANVMQEIHALKQSIEGKKESICILGGFLPSYADALKSPKIKDDFKAPLPKEIYLNLIAHRADISVQKYIVLSKSQNIENAKAQFYPNISLSSFIGLISLDINKFFDNSSFAPTTGVAFSLPIFDGGERKANLKTNVSDYNSSVHDYNNVVIKAANEVVGVLKKSKLLESQISSHEESLVAKNINKKIALEKFNIGLTNKLPYLKEKIDIYQSELTEIDLHNEKASLQIELIKALGGGYVDNNESRHANN